MDGIEKLVEIVKKLRVGCPWDKEQTHKSIRGHLVEECAELLDAIDNEDFPNMREELGDILMHVVLHCEIADEQLRFNLQDVVSDLCEKLIRRHPHVFGEKKVSNSDEVLKIWTDVKSTEKKTRPKYDDFWENIPKNLTALRTARDVSKNLDKQKISDLNKTIDLNNKELNHGKEIFESIAKTVDSGMDPENVLRDYILFLKKSTNERTH